MGIQPMDRFCLSATRTRTSQCLSVYSTLWMIGGSMFIVYIGHLYIWAMVAVLVYHSSTG
uniref:Phosphatidate cytidylyltransferase n=1 Tax=Aegilops tauschii subsp. strangulata TaxID=200361 RepID=A0A453TDT4_AEGTS